MSLYSRGVSHGFRSFDPQSKRIEEEVVFVLTGTLSGLYRSLDPQPRESKRNRTGCLCTSGDTLRALGLLTLSQRESKRRTEQVVFVLPVILSEL